MAEFTRLSDVDVVENPSNAANVLIEEDGVIKKAPKTAVGGAGGGWDAIIYLESDSYMFIDSDNIRYTFVQGSYESIKNVWDKGELPKIRLDFEDSYNFTYYHRIESDSVKFVYAHIDGSDRGFLATFSTSSHYSGTKSKPIIYLQINPDNTITNIGLDYSYV